MSDRIFFSNPVFVVVNMKEVKQFLFAKRNYVHVFFKPINKAK